MGLAREAFRLLKTRWADPQLLAEELYLILLQDQDGTLGPTAVQQAAADEPFFLPPDLAEDPNPDLNLPSLDLPQFPENPLEQGQAENDGHPPQRVLTTTATYHTRVALPGQVGTGSGGLYDVTLYPNSTQDRSDFTHDLRGEPFTVAVSGVKQLDGSEDVEEGAWALVFRHSQFEVKTTTLMEGTQKKQVLSTEVKVVQRQHEMQVAVAGGGGIPLKITGGGPGSTYTANAYPQGPDQEGVEVSVRILQIDATETVPAGTWLLGTKLRGKYYAQPGIFVNG